MQRRPKTHFIVWLKNKAIKKLTITLLVAVFFPCNKMNEITTETLILLRLSNFHLTLGSDFSDLYFHALVVFSITTSITIVTMHITIFTNHILVCYQLRVHILKRNNMIKWKPAGNTPVLMSTPHISFVLRYPFTNVATDVLCKN
jgi:hypothetical protein